MKHIGKNTKELVQKFIHDHPMGVLSTASLDNEPWGAALYCVADEDFKFYFVTREHTRKYSNIARNPQVSLTIADNESQREVQVAGVVSLVPTKEVIDIVFKKLAHVKPHADVHWVPPVIKVHQGDWMVLCITPSYVQYADFKQRTTRASEDYITRII